MDNPEAGPPSPRARRRGLFAPLLFFYPWVKSGGSSLAAPPGARRWAILALLVSFNLGIMAVDSLVLPAQGPREAPVTPPPQGEVRQLRRPTQLDFFTRNFGWRPVGVEGPP